MSELPSVNLSASNRNVFRLSEGGQRCHTTTSHHSTAKQCVSTTAWRVYITRTHLLLRWPRTLTHCFSVTSEYHHKSMYCQNPAVGLFFGLHSCLREYGPSFNWFYVRMKSPYATSYYSINTNLRGVQFQSYRAALVKISHLGGGTCLTHCFSAISGNITIHHIFPKTTLWGKKLHHFVFAITSSKRFTVK